MLCYSLKCRSSIAFKQAYATGQNVTFSLSLSNSVRSQVECRTHLPPRMYWSRRLSSLVHTMTVLLEYTLLLYCSELEWTRYTVDSTLLRRCTNSHSGEYIRDTNSTLSLTHCRQKVPTHVHSY